MTRRAELPTPSLSATIEQGVYQGHVRIHAQPRRRIDPARAPRTRQDRASRGRGYIVYSVSMPPDVVARINAAAAHLRIARSDLLRRAALEMIDRLEIAMHDAKQDPR